MNHGANAPELLASGSDVLSVESKDREHRSALARGTHGDAEVVSTALTRTAADAFCEVERDGVGCASELVFAIGAAEEVTVESPDPGNELQGHFEHIQTLDVELKLTTHSAHLSTGG